MKFAHPEWIAVAWGLAILAGGVLFLLHKRHLGILSWLPQNTRLAFPLVRTLLRGLLFVSLLLAWIEPVINIKKVGDKQADRIVWYLLDVSASMQTQDVAHNRISVAKEAIVASIKRMAGARVGVILFSNSALVQVPLTHDRAAAIQLTNLITGQELAAGPAQLRQALLLAHKRTVSATQKNEKAANIIIISDGEVEPENYASILYRFKQDGAIIWTVAVGTEQGGFIPNILNTGDPVLSKTQLSGFEPIKKYFNEQTLALTTSPQNAFVNIEDKFVYSLNSSDNERDSFSLRAFFLVLAILLGLGIYFARPYQAIES